MAFFKEKIKEFLVSILNQKKIFYNLEFVKFEYNSNEYIIPFNPDQKKIYYLNNTKFTLTNTILLLILKAFYIKNPEFGLILMKNYNIELKDLPSFIRLYEDLNLVNDEFDINKYEESLQVRYKLKYGLTKSEVKDFRKPNLTSKNTSNRAQKRALIKEAKEVAKKEKKLQKQKRQENKLIGTNKPNLLVPKEEIFIKSTGFGTLGELLGVVESNNQIEIDSKANLNNLKPFHKQKIQKNKINNNDNVIESLVLWDMENIHYYDDFSKITRYVKTNNQIRLMCFNSKYRNYEHINRLNFILTKLKKRDWIIKETKKIADEILIEYFHKYKNSLKELIIISNDSDFNDILKEANDLNIKTIVLHRNGRDRPFHWYEKASEYYDLRNIN